MPETVNINISIDKDTKERAERMFGDFGMSLSVAFNLFVQKSLQQGTLPFDVTDTFYSKENQDRLRKSINSYQNNKVVVKTTAELEAMENE
ncbi:MAG: type II toxin-antitoxin system RelB/DinJ family antitoxin [Planctomycetaceae bacterium]|jgi:DNA-damage-inducible protein J|nr:type II toxin-antitoxin system RelB/DinJ family antitoxin [Planctomycetaceae bacterium]